jgi:hypothetical protein
MRQIKTILTIIFFLSFLGAYPNKDRGSIPVTFIFIFQNNDTTKLNNPSDSLLRIYSDDIINHRKELIKTELSFKSGEILTLKTEGSRWTSIIISDGKMEISIPDTIIEKISEIHFNTVWLAWSSNSEKAFTAGYFYLRFEIGKERSFYHYPELKLYFSEQKYTKATITRQVDINKRRDSDFPYSKNEDTEKGIYYNLLNARDTTTINGYRLRIMRTRSMSEFQFDSLIKIANNKNVFVELYVSGPRTNVKLLLKMGNDSIIFDEIPRTWFSKFNDLLYTEDKDWLANVFMYNLANRSGVNLIRYEDNDYERWKKERKEQEIKEWKKWIW